MRQEAVGQTPAKSRCAQPQLVHNFAHDNIGLTSRKRPGRSHLSLPTEDLVCKKTGGRPFPAAPPEQFIPHRPSASHRCWTFSLIVFKPKKDMPDELHPSREAPA
jgi:hypothetical protein